MVQPITCLGKAQETISSQGESNGTNYQENEDIDADDDNNNPAETADHGFDPANLTELQNIRPKIPGTVAPRRNARPSNQPTKKPINHKSVDM